MQELKGLSEKAAFLNLPPALAGGTGENPTRALAEIILVSTSLTALAKTSLSTLG
jgi:hypothetical protein